MNKLFKPRTMRRICLLLALMFPLVYLMGSLFFVLNGSHGNQLVSADAETSNKVVVDNRIYTYLIPPSNRYVGYTAISSPVFVGASSSGLYVVDTLDHITSISNFAYIDGVETESYVGFDLRASTNHAFVTEVLSSDYFQFFVVDALEPSHWFFYQCRPEVSPRFVSYDNLAYSDGEVSWSFSFYVYFSMPSDLNFSSFTEQEFRNYIGNIPLTPGELPQTDVSYSDYLFSQPFAENNFVSKLGKDVLTDDVGGFAPVGDLLRWVDSNVLNFGVDDRLALFGYGYVYYAVNVLIVYEVIVIASSLLMLPLKVVDKLDRERSE